MAIPTISVVIPVYNRGQYLSASVESVLAQTYRDWELIIVDDNSTDDSPRLIQRFCARDDRIRGVRNDRYAHSAAGARLRALDEIRGEFVAFLDSDDRWVPHHLDRLHALLADHDDIDWIFSDTTRVDSEGRTLVESVFETLWPVEKLYDYDRRGDLYVLHHDGMFERALLHPVECGLQPSLLRRRVLRKVSLREIYVGEDQLFALEAIAAGFRMAFVKEVHVIYLVHDQNVSLAVAGPSPEQMKKINEEICRLYGDYIPRWITLTSGQRRVLEKRLASHLVWNLGYNTYRKQAAYRAALRATLQGVSLDPLNGRYWRALGGALFAMFARGR